MKNRVRELRKLKGLTQEQLLHEVIGVLRQTINAIEKGEVRSKLTHSI